jgi:hypothetical protein
MAGGKMLFNPAEWLWYWQLVFFVLALPLGIGACIGAYALRKKEGWMSVCILFAINCLIPCGIVGYLGARVLLVSASYISVGIAAGVAAVGSLITNLVNSSGSSVSSTHEWRTSRGARFSSANNRAVWEHHHGSGSWARRMVIHRIVWGILAVAAAVIQLRNTIPPPAPLHLWATGTVSLFAVAVILLVLKR